MKASQDLEPELVEIRQLTKMLQRAGSGLSETVKQFPKSPFRVGAASGLIGRAITRTSNSRRRMRLSRWIQCYWAELKKRIAR
jgi:hypothetical protein